MTDFIIQGTDASGQRKNVSVSDMLTDTNGNIRTGFVNKVANVSSLIQTFKPDDLTDLVARYTSTENHIEHSGTDLDDNTAGDPASEWWVNDTAPASSFPVIISAWFKPNDIPSSGSAAIVASADFDGFNDEIRLIIRPTGLIGFTHEESGVNSDAETTNSVTAGEWSHVVAEVTASSVTVVLDGDWSSRGTNTGLSLTFPSGIDNISLGTRKRNGTHIAANDARYGRVDLWLSGSLTQIKAENLARGDDPATAFESRPDHTWFDQSTDGTDSGVTGGLDLSSNGTPVAHNECYVLRDRVSTRHLLATTSGPTWSNDALSTGKKGLVFDDTNPDFMQFDGGQAVTVAPFTMWVRAASDETTAANVVASLGDKDVATDFWQIFFAGGTAGDPIKWQAKESGTGSAETSTGYSSSTTHLLTAIEAAADDRTVRLDGGGTGTDSTSKTPAGADRFRLGGQADSTPGADFSGAFHELVLIDDTPTAQEESDMEGYDLYSDETPEISNAEFDALIINETRREASLPSASAAQGPVSVYANDALGITLNAASGDTIRLASSVSSAGGSINSTTQGSSLTLVAISDSQWVAVFRVGNWSTA